MSVLEMRQVSRTYGQGAAEVHALDHINLSVDAGSMVAVMGPSGSGKSTLLTIAGSLEDPTGENGEPDFPVPWADRPGYSHLTTSDRLRTAIATSGFEIEQWNDLTGQAATMMQTLLTLPPSPIGLQAFVPTSRRKPRTSPPRWPTTGCAPSRASHEPSETCRHPFGPEANHDIEDRRRRARRPHGRRRHGNRTGELP